MKERKKIFYFILFVHTHVFNDIIFQRFHKNYSELGLGGGENSGQLSGEEPGGGSSGAAGAIAWREIIRFSFSKHFMISRGFTPAETRRHPRVGLEAQHNGFRQALHGASYPGSDNSGG